jgi:hypothetical protein
MIYHGNRAIDAALACAGFVKIHSMTRGFVFSFLGHRVSPIVLAIALHRVFQRLVDCHIPVIHSLGMAYFVLARKPS